MLDAHNAGRVGRLRLQKKKQPKHGIKGAAMEQLKPCDHCESQAFIFDDCPLFGVVCPTCEHEIKGYASEQEAIEAWNRRAGDE